MHFDHTLHVDDVHFHKLLQFDEAALELSAHIRGEHAPAFPFVLCGPQVTATGARAALGEYVPIKWVHVSFASHTDGVACWGASLHARDAHALKASPFFFHVTPVPAAAKFAPALLAMGAAGALHPTAYAFADMRGRGLRVHTAPGVDGGARARLIQEWAAAGFGLSGDHAHSFFSMASEYGGAGWRAAREAASSNVCASLLATRLEGALSTGPLRLSFVRSDKSDKSVQNQCALIALAFLVSQPAVHAIEVAPLATPTYVPAQTIKAVSQAEGVLEKLRAEIATAGNDAPMNYPASIALQSANHNDPTPFWDMGVNGTGEYVQVLFLF